MDPQAKSIGLGKNRETRHDATNSSTYLISFVASFFPKRLTALSLRACSALSQKYRSDYERAPAFDKGNVRRVMSSSTITSISVGFKDI